MRYAFAIAVLTATIWAISAESRQPPETHSAVDLPSADLLPVSLQVLHDSGTIFSGTVLRVEHRNADSSSALAITRIVFRVDEAIRNVRRGQTIEINEWLDFGSRANAIIPENVSYCSCIPPADWD